MDTPQPQPTGAIASPTPHSPEPQIPDTEARRKTWWRRFGGDGFLISLGVHVILALVAIFWVVTTWVDKKSDGDPDVFATGAGGGTQGDRAKIFEHRIKPRNARNMVSTPTKIVAKGSSSLSLPEMPNVSMSAMLSGNLAGGSSKGLGGGSGGGIGTGQGVGRGGGKNKVSLFGITGFGANTGLIGTFYDLKQFKNGSETDMAFQDGSDQRYVEKVRDYARNRNKTVLERYFQAPEKLATTQIYMTQMSADEAPKAFGVPQVQPRHWLVHYTGAVRAPKSGKFRFVGLGDDILAVYWDNRLVLDAGYDFVSEKLQYQNNTSNVNLKNGTGTRITDEQEAKWGKPEPNNPYVHHRTGRWIEVTVNKEYPVDILIGETPGSIFQAYVMMEEMDPRKPNEGSGSLVLFKIGTGPLPDQIANGHEYARCDMSGGSWVWTPVMRRNR